MNWEETKKILIKKGEEKKKHKAGLIKHNWVTSNISPKGQPKPNKI